MITKYPVYSQLSNSSFYRFLFAFVIYCLNLDPDKGHTFTLVEIPPRSHLIYRFPQIIFSLQLFCWRNQVVYTEVFPWVWILQAMNQWGHLVCFFAPIFFGKLIAISKSLIKCFFVFCFLQDYFSGGVICCGWQVALIIAPVQESIRGYKRVIFHHSFFIYWLEYFYRETSLHRQSDYPKV